MLPITGFLIYFTYFYQTLTFWAIIFAVCTWMLLTKLIAIGGEYFKAHEIKSLSWCIRVCGIFIYYFSPLFTLIWASIKFSDSGMAILLGLLWYVAIVARYLSDRIHKYNIKMFTDII